MASEIRIQSGQKYSASTELDFSWLERFVLKCFHPRAIFIEVVGLAWSLYYFWNYNW